MSQWKDLLYDSEQRGHAARNYYVCGDCLDDDALAQYVCDNAEECKCDFCNRQGETPFATSLGDVIEYMDEHISQEYTDAAGELPYETAEGGFQGVTFDGDDLLREVGFECDSDELRRRIAGAFEDTVWCRRDYFSLSPSERLQYGWESFKRVVMHERRFTFWSVTGAESEYHPDYMPVGGMLSVIGGCIAQARLVKTFPKGTRIWRVRVHDGTRALTDARDLGPPPPKAARQSSRMSPAGIVMFYGAESFETARAETVRPRGTKGDRVTGGIFVAVRDLQLLDLAELPRMPSFFGSDPDYRHSLRFLRDFATDLSKPIAGKDGEPVQYSPTQAFTEYVRFELGAAVGGAIDGIRYHSAVDGTPCYVLFCGQDECVNDTQSASGAAPWLRLDSNSVRTESVTDLKRAMTETSENG